MGLEKKNGPITPTGVRARKGGEEIPTGGWCKSMRLRRGKQGHRSSLQQRRKGAAGTHGEKLPASPDSHHSPAAFRCSHRGINATGRAHQKLRAYALRESVAQTLQKEISELSGQAASDVTTDQRICHKCGHGYSARYREITNHTMALLTSSRVRFENHIRVHHQRETRHSQAETDVVRSKWTGPCRGTHVDCHACQGKNGCKCHLDKSAVWT
ncbi:hypothetical protein GO285_01423 [Ralstonia solanacearum]|nr:hypothetical protein [Ralstonia solanacearum]NKG09647.1 hypothetical protein [Ralstonia solanacearum]